MIDHLDMRKIREARGRIRRELLRVEFDGGFHRIPIVVDRLAASGAHHADGLHLNGVRQCDLCAPAGFAMGRLLAHS